ncbi:DUF1036 domain-containing protein [Maricaulis sp. D1M11]
MMAFRFLSLALCLSALIVWAPSSARADEMCNETSYIVQVATAWPVENGVTVRGWTRVRPDECEELPGTEDLDPDIPVYIYAKTSAAYLGGVREWRGTVSLCVDETDFDILMNTQCSALGLATREFFVREGEQRNRTILAEPEDFGRRADEAGLQRLLQAAGFEVASVDGYVGRRTNNAAAAFRRQQGLGSGVTGPALLDALEAASLQRNARSGLTVCNNSGGDVSVAIAQRREDIWEARGWWRLYIGQCARVSADHLGTDSMFVYAQRERDDAVLPLLGGEDVFCMAPARFLAEGRDECESRGYQAVNYRRIPAPEDGGVQMTLTEIDFVATGDN